MIEIEALNTDMIRELQEEIRDAHRVLDRLRVASNGAGGKGKREEFSLAQRIEDLIRTFSSGAGAGYGDSFWK